MQHCQDLADIYLYFLAKNRAKEAISFFTKTKLFGYDYFPNPLPDAYLAVKNGSNTKRYFLDIFSDYTPPFVIRRRVREYITYRKRGEWEVNTNNSQFPVILFILPNAKLQKHVYYYAKSVLEKSFEDVAFFLTTKDIIEYGAHKKNIWQKIE